LECATPSAHPIAIIASVMARARRPPALPRPPLSPAPLSRSPHNRLSGCFIGLGLVVIVAGLIAAAGLVAMQTWVVQRTGSTAISADRAHYATDVAVNVAVLAALGVTRLTGWERADPVFAMAISGYMLWNSRGIALEALEATPDAITVTQLVRLVGTPDAPVLVDVRIDNDHASDPRMLPASVRRDHRTVSSWAEEYGGRSVVVVCQRGQKLAQGTAAWLRRRRRAR
jgi:hypothetical protein